MALGAIWDRLVPDRRPILDCHGRFAGIVADGVDRLCRGAAPRLVFRIAPLVLGRIKRPQRSGPYKNNARRVWFRACRQCLPRV